MKHSYFVFILFILSAVSSNAQWITLYEGGNNTTHNLNDEWGSHFFFGAGSGNQATCIFGSSSVDNNCRMFYYYEPFGTGAAGIYKKIPGMENYASLRVKLRMTLPDTIGSIDYYAVNLDQNGQNGNGYIDSNWNHFGSDVLDQYVYLSNTDGDSSIYFRTELLRGDSIHFSYDYVLIEADTTQMLNISTNNETTFDLFSDGTQINIQASNNQETYAYTITSLSGNEMIQGQATGNTLIQDEFESGIYIVVIEGVTSTTTKKVYIY